MCLRDFGNGMKKIRIKNHLVGNGEPCFIISEVGQSHDGSLGIAHAYIDAAAEVGVDAIKFQTHIASAESTLDEPFRVRFSNQDETRYDYWKRMEFSAEQWCGLAKHAQDKGLVFLSSAFSVEAVKLLSQIGMPAWKVGSGETSSSQLFDAMLDSGGAILLSTGMSTWAEIDKKVAEFNDKNVEYAILQCTSKYPTGLEEVGLNILDEFGKLYKCPVGLSDHTGTPFPALAAMARNCHILELHVTFDKRMFGPDVPASLTFEELAFVVQARNAFAKMQANPVDKDSMAADLNEMRKIFGKSLALTTTLAKGTVLKKEHITTKKPGSGIPIDQISKIIGRTLARDVAHNRLIRWEDLSD